MRKIYILFLCLICSLVSLPVSAISESQEKAVAEHCDSIRSVLKSVQKTDARTRVYLGGYYEAILSRFVTPLNVRLVENNLSSAGLVENQNKLVNTRELFISDFISYQQDLEELVSMDCTKEPGNFYNKLEKVRQKRKIVEQDTLKMRSLLSEHVKLVTELEGKV